MSNKNNAEQNSKPARMVYFVCDDFFVEGHGYRVSIVMEGEKGHRPTGTWPFHGGLDEKMPYFFGPTLAEAQKRCLALNLRMGIDARETALIVASSMA